MTQPYQKPSADDLLFGGGGPKGFSFKQIGQSITGILVEKDSMAKTDPVTKEVKTYKDGNPIHQVVLTLQTNFRNWEGVPEDKRPDTPDDGLRRVFCSPQMKTEVAKAVKAASPGGKSGLPEGSEITVTFVREVPNSMGTGNPKKEYTVSVRLPADVALLGGAQPQQQVQQPVQQQPVQQPVQQPAQQQLTPELLALLQAQLAQGGVPPQQ